MSVRVFAPAKINLTLEVGRPRADGLHPIQSVVVFADVGDVVDVEAAASLTLAINGEFAGELAADESNLVLRAARALAAHAAVSEGAALSLEKNLPIASGIGGGSSDAAAALRALDKLWGLNLGLGELAKIGATLGADVPVCLTGAPAYVTGVGDDVTAIAVQSLPAVLINPLLPLATADVYRAFDRMDLGRSFAPHPPPRWSTTREAAQGILAIGNHLEAPARSLLHQVDEVLAILKADDRVEAAAMSGSGATVFGLVADMEAAASLADDLQTRHPDWWVAETLLGGA